MSTAFKIGDVVKATTTAQKMERGKEYTVTGIVQKHTAFGNFVTYELVQKSKRRIDALYRSPFPVVNLHLLATKVS